MTSRIALFLAALLICTLPARAQGGDDLAQKLANPIASLVSIPFQLNFDEGLGPGGNGTQTVLNIQPVLPFSLGDDWNLISRTILPLVRLEDATPGGGTVSGLGDTVQSLFFSPARPTAGGMTWGVGPVFLLPTATDNRLGAEKWGAGPTAVALVQTGPWTFGGLGNHIWSFAGEDRRQDVNRTFLQPFISYNTANAWTFSLNTESSYDWKSDRISVPVNATVAKLVRVGDTPVSLFGGLRYWAEPAPGGPDGWGLRLGWTVLLP